MIKNGVDIVDHVRPAPRVPLLEPLAAVQDVLRVIGHDGPAVGARIRAPGVLLCRAGQGPLGSSGERLENGPPVGDCHFERGVGDVTVPFGV